MASGGVKALARESLTCAVCLKVYRCPRQLPCTHTFCESCLVDLVSCHPTGRFPCPECREEIEVPPAGALGFKLNHYLKEEDLERARNGTYCATHPTQEPDLLCKDCDMALCFKSVLTKHKSHDTQDLSQAAAVAKSQLSQDQRRLQQHVNHVQKQEQLLTQEQQAVKDKHAQLVRHIQGRQAALKAAVDQHTEEAMASLAEVTFGILDTLEAKLGGVQHKLGELRELAQRVEQVLDRAAGPELLAVAREMTSDPGSQLVLQQLTSEEVTTVRRPVLRFTATPPYMLQRMRDYMESADTVEMALSPLEVTVMEQFQCRKDPDNDVYHLCPLTDGKVWVAYEPHMLRRDVVAELFSADGKFHSNLRIDDFKKITQVRRKNGTCLYAGTDKKKHIIFAKRCGPDLGSFFRLSMSSKTKACVQTIIIESEEPFSFEIKDLFRIRCAPHRAFDVDAGQQLFVVLEEGQPPDYQRRVQLYRHGQQEAIATYSPPVSPSRPADVCFFTLGGQEVLLVADELNDAIHVVNVLDGQLTFSRYLAPGCPLLVQPTALNTDPAGNLWVGCRGGRILLCKPTNGAPSP